MVLATASLAHCVDEPAAPVQLRVIDTDVHHGIRTTAELHPYLSQTYKERLAEYGFGGGGLYAHNGGRKGYRLDSLDDDSPPGVSVVAVNVEKTRRDLLDAAGIDIAILTGASVYGACTMPDLDYGSAICRAFNDFTIEHWLPADSRFRYAISIGHQDPDGAAKEIDRIGDHPAIVAVAMPCGAPRPFGQRFYHPIYEACARHNLVVALHFNGEGIGVNPPLTAAGYPSYYVEGRQARPSFYQAHLASFIFEGAFERFPTLKVAMLEGGFAWVPAYQWKMDADWKGLRHQTPWVKRLPSEYIREHVRFASQPMDEPDDPEAIPLLIKW
ncbi:MAG TPA: amidohydrolase family protein, partial [Chloroflexota bacterium]|nr:amidohydrolase family protein [Chloroflexota bacterium]